jgi:hypothetical protein
MADAPASGPLHMLQSELNGAKSQWESLQDRILNGYKDAYKLHVGALQKMQQARLLEEQQEARTRGYYMFVLSVVSVGFAGGLAGGLIGNWLNSAVAKEIASHQAVVEALEEIGVKWTPQAIISPLTRETIKGIGSQAAKDLVGVLVPKSPSRSEIPASAYAPVSPQPFDVYLDKKAELDDCFASINEHLQEAINLANKQNWPAGVGWSLLDAFRKGCPLLRDAPRQDQLPRRDQIAKPAELGMWIAWTNARDWAYWSNTYRWIDDYAQGLTSWDEDDPLFKDAARLDPVLQRLNALGKGDLVTETLGKRNDDRNMPDIDGIAYQILDMRKVRVLRLQDMPDLPFAKMKDLSFSQLDNVVGLGKFLDGLSSLRPPYTN